MNKIIINLTMCDGCKKCVRACFANVLCWQESEKKPAASYPEDCVHCNTCELACPNQCITVVPDFAAMRWSAL